MITKFSNQILKGENVSRLTGLRSSQFLLLCLHGITEAEIYFAGTSSSTILCKRIALLLNKLMRDETLPPTTRPWPWN